MRPVNTENSKTAHLSQLQLNIHTSHINTTETRPTATRPTAMRPTATALRIFQDTADEIFPAS
jgi:hypothetical protein